MGRVPVLDLKRKRPSEASQNDGHVNAANTISGNTSAVNPFDMLSNELHGHILSFLTCLRHGYARPSRTALVLCVEHHRRDCVESNPNDFHPDHSLQASFYRLSKPQQQEWKNRERQDWLRSRAEDAMCTRPHELVLLCQGLALVSTRWMQVMDLVMNPMAPRDSLSPYQLACLKRRVLSLSLSNVCAYFANKLRDQYEDVSFPEEDGGYVVDQFGFQDEQSPYQVVVEHFRYDGGVVNVVATEYARFLVTKCVEKVAASKDQPTPLTNAWKQPCRPCELVGMFWKCHMMFPKQYARDCYELLGPLLLKKDNDNNMTAMDTIIDCNMKRNDTTNGIVDYKRKRSNLFHFEKQLNGDGETYFGRFGDYCEAPSTDCLLNDSFDIIQVAKKCRKEEEDSDDYE